MTEKQKYKSVSMPAELYDLVQSVTLASSVTVGRRLYPHRVLAAALVLARSHPAEMEALLRGELIKPTCTTPPITS